MTDRDREEPLSSDDLIRQAKESLGGRPDDDAIAEIVGDLEDIEVDVPVEDEFPDPIPRMETRARQQQRPRRVISAYDTSEDPFDRDQRSRRPVVAAVAALVIIAIGVAIALYAAANGF